MSGPDESARPLVLEGVGYDLPDGRTILQAVDLTVDGGETVALVGRSGSGKTTLLKTVNRLLEPSRGTVRVAGRATTAWDPVELRRGIGWVIQEIGLFPHMTIAENVGLVPRLRGWDRDRTADRIEELLETVGLPPDEFAGRHPHQLSGGQRQRVGVARALGADPPLLLLDEPFGALDPITRTSLQDEFRAIMDRLGKAALFVTHDLREALALGDRVGMLDDGRLVEIASPSDFVASETAAVRDLVVTLEAGGEEATGG